MTSHLLERARERLGVELTAEDERNIIADIAFGHLPPTARASDRRAWYETTIQGVPAWVLYDCAARSLVTILAERPAGLPQSCPTLYALADEYGISHAEGKRIAGRVFEHLRHAHKGTVLVGHQAKALRPLFETAKNKEAIMPPLAIVPEVKTMDSREIAELTGKAHDKVTLDIEMQLGQVGDIAAFRDIYTDSMNRKRTCYKLPYRETMILVSGYSVELRARVVDRWLELERAARPALPDFSNPVAAARAWADEVEAKQKAEQALEIAAPKVEAFDRFLDASGSLCISDAAKALGRRPLKFFNELAGAGIIFKRGGDWLPAQDKLERGWFEVKTLSYGDPPHVIRQTRVTPAGLEALGKLYPREATA